MLKKLFAAAVLCMASLTANAKLVDLELQLLADVSGSVDAAEYALQLQGYENAFRSSSVINAIMSGSVGGIAVQYVEWSSSTQQMIQVDWAFIDSAASANAFADALNGLSRAFSGGTVIGSAITFGAAQFDNNGYESARQVIDVSGDGSSGAFDTMTARDNALAAGIDAINGITIGNEVGLPAFYQTNVVGGTNAFHIHADSFADFQAGIERKLIREIQAVPAPATLAIFALGLLGLARTRRS